MILVTQANQEKNHKQNDKKKNIANTVKEGMGKLKRPSSIVFRVRFLIVERRDDLRREREVKRELRSGIAIPS